MASTHHRSGSLIPRPAMRQPGFAGSTVESPVLRGESQRGAAKASLHVVLLGPLAHAPF